MSSLNGFLFLLHGSSLGNIEILLSKSVASNFVAVIFFFAIKFLAFFLSLRIFTSSMGTEGANSS